MASKVALVTGAGSGIGRAVSLALDADGWSVVLAGRRTQELEKTASHAKRDSAQRAKRKRDSAQPEDAKRKRDSAQPQDAERKRDSAQPQEMLAVPTDVTNPAAVRALFKKTQDVFGRLDLLFNNAGTGAPPVPMEDLTFEQWTAAVDVNLTGAFLCAQEAIKIMKSQNPRGGRIINNGSISAHTPRPNSAPYTATKHAITGLTKCISLDGRKYDIACGQIDIGNAASEMTERMATGIIQANGTMMSEPRLDLKHVCAAVLYMANLPLEANVQFMTVMATKMPFVGRG